jgi:hypothetical protein
LQHAAKIAAVVGDPESRRAPKSTGENAPGTDIGPYVIPIVRVLRNAKYVDQMWILQMHNTTHTYLIMLWVILKSDHATDRHTPNTTTLEESKQPTKQSDCGW